jgi:hypothetical protein
MAGFASIAAAGQSIVRVLNLAFETDPPVEGRRTQAVLVRSADFQESQVSTAIGANALSVFLYRVDCNKVMRAAWSAVAAVNGRAHLALDLHYLLTPWSDNAQHEHRILGRAVQSLEESPILSGPLLDPGGDWALNEAIQLVMEELPTETLMRTFDSLPTDYRLSVPYIARVVRVDGRVAQPEVPVTTLVGGLVPSLEP